ncbi:hypothetical protein [Thiocystis violacea]|uniref:hypothetical protein n=1 Tax=Thiocystis violacea TaxID=13725 RepID=UPI001905C4C1|nr:hypothetical protein [Thiocystis violacea]MBK1723410.1 hypothetical protein [Thiocystis violacea]
MHQTSLIRRPLGLLLALTIAAPGVALAYDTKDAIRDCEDRLRSEYGLIDLRESRGVQLPGDKTYRVEGKTKIDGEKYPWTCDVQRRRVVNLEYRGRRPSRAGGPPGGGGPEVVPRRSGEVEVRLPGGCMTLYDRRGDLINRGSRCSPGDRRRADDAAAAYFREQRHGGDRRNDDRRNDDRRNDDRRYDDRGGSGRGNQRDSELDIDLSKRGSGRVRFDNDCVVYYEKGRRSTVSPQCSGRQVDRADKAVDDSLR